MTTQTTAAPTTPGDAAPDTSFTRVAFERHVGQKSEPAWLQQVRRDAFDAFERLPMPTNRERAWKYYDPTRLRLGGLTLGYDAANLDAQPPSAPDALAGAGAGRASAAWQVDNEAVAMMGGEGFYIAPLSYAAQDGDHANLVCEHLGAVVSPTESKFAALNSAFWDGGLLIHVPKDTEIERPVHLVFEQRTPGLALFPRILVILERGAKLTLVEERVGSGDDGGFCAGVTEFVVGEGADLKHYVVQRWGAKMQDVSIQRATLARDAKSTTLVAGLGGEATKWWVDAKMQGAGSESNMLGVFFGTGGQHFDVITTQDHIGEHTTSDLLYKAALKDRSVGAYYGLTRVGPNARGTAANQEDRNLLLSPKAKADADPVLEILTSDVIRCGHGASAGPVDPEQLFYLACRGLPRPEAEKLLIMGFLHQVTERIPLESVRDTIERGLIAKMGGEA